MLWSCTFLHALHHINKQNPKKPPIPPPPNKQIIILTLCLLCRSDFSVLDGVFFLLPIKLVISLLLNWLLFIRLLRARYPTIYIRTPIMDRRIQHWCSIHTAVDILIDMKQCYIVDRYIIIVYLKNCVYGNGNSLWFWWIYCVESVRILFARRLSLRYIWFHIEWNFALSIHKV